jgi:hypothetical protein
MLLPLIEQIRYVKLRVQDARKMQTWAKPRSNELEKYFNTQILLYESLLESLLELHNR